MASTVIARVKAGKPDHPVIEGRSGMKVRVLQLHPVDGDLRSVLFSSRRGAGDGTLIGVGDRSEGFEANPGETVTASVYAQEQVTFIVAYEHVPAEGEAPPSPPPLAFLTDGQDPTPEMLPKVTPMRSRRTTHALGPESFPHGLVLNDVPYDPLELSKHWIEVLGWDDPEEPTSYRLVPREQFEKDWAPGTGLTNMGGVV